MGFSAIKNRNNPYNFLIIIEGNLIVILAPINKPSATGAADEVLYCTARPSHITPGNPTGKSNAPSEVPIAIL